MQDSAHILQAQVAQAAREGTPLAICGGGSKAFYGRALALDRLETGIHHGITEYAPTELVITARGGTPLEDIEKALRDNGQMLACEPPAFAGGATFGGMLATGLSGPSRPYRAAVQDTVLGCTILNGNGEILRFGGKVMKNVAGYDVSRLMVGAMGCLGVILEATVKVVPLAAAETSAVFTIARNKAPALVNAMRRQGLPVTGDCHDGNTLRVRFSAGEKEIAGIPARLSQHYSFLPWQPLDDAGFWSQLRNQALPFFDTERDTWRLSVPAGADLTALKAHDEDLLTEWGGCLHWLKTTENADTVFDTMAACNGHGALFRRGGQREDDRVFQPLSPLHQDWHRRLKQAFDPAGILNPGRMYAEF